MRHFIRHCLLLLVALLIQSCGGGGGGGTSSNGGSQPPTPLSVDTSSFLNKGAADLANFRVPNLRFIANTGGYVSIPETLAVADFERSGQYSAFVVGELTERGTKYTRGFFLKYDSSTNRWSDDSDQRFDPAADRSSCDDPKLGLVSKLNADDRPDIYVVCAGGGANGVKQQLYVSSGVGGKYIRQETLFEVDATSASIADIDGDQLADIVTNHGSDLYKVLSRSAASIWLAAKSQIVVRQTPFPSFIQGVFLIPRDAERYLLVAGYGSSGPPQNSIQNSISWYANNQGAFDSTRSDGFTISALASDIYFYDYVERQDSQTMTYGYLYAYTRSARTNTYKNIIRIEAPLAGASLPISRQTTWTYQGTLPAATSWPSRLTIKAGYLSPYDAGCLSNPITNTDGRCSLSFVDSWSNFN